MIGSHYRYLGEPREAMRWLERAYDMRSGALGVAQRRAPGQHAEVPRRPAYDGLIRRIGLPD